MASLDRRTVESQGNCRSCTVRRLELFLVAYICQFSARGGAARLGLSRRHRYQSDGHLVADGARAVDIFEHNDSFYLAVVLRDPSTDERRFARVKVPPLLPRFVVMPDGERFVPLEQVIATNLDLMFPTPPKAVYCFRATRGTGGTPDDATVTVLYATDDLAIDTELAATDPGSTAYACNRTDMNTASCSDQVIAYPACNTNFTSSQPRIIGNRATQTD